MSIKLLIQEKSNNRYIINGESIYAPNIATAIARYEEKFGAGAKIMVGGKNLCKKQ